MAARPKSSLRRSVCQSAWGLLGFCFCTILAGLSPSALAQVVIVHPSISEDAVSRTGLRAIFSGRLQNYGDQRLTVFVYDDRDPVHVNFSKEVLGVFPYQLRGAWNRAVFAGTGSAPISVQSETEMLRRVSETVGGIGYLASPGQHLGTRILAVEGVRQ